MRLARDSVCAQPRCLSVHSPGARKKFLLAILANGPVAKTEIEEAAKAEGISERTLYRAKRELKNVVAKKDAADGGWTWRLAEAPSNIG